MNSGNLPGTSSQLYLQVGPGSKITEAQIVPMHFIENNLQYASQDYSIPVLQQNIENQLQLVFGPDKHPMSIESAIAISNEDLLRLTHQTQIFTKDPCSVTDILQEEVNNETEKDNVLSLVSNNVSRMDPVETSNKVVKKSKIQKYLNNKPYVHIPDRVVPPRALAVLPEALDFSRGHIWPRRRIPFRVLFGPVEGVRRKLSFAQARELATGAAAGTPVCLLVGEDPDDATHIDVSDKDKSNWLSLLPLAPPSEEPSLWLVQQGGSLWAASGGPLAARRPLTLGYPRQYGDRWGLPGHERDLDGVPPLMSCEVCGQSAASAAELQRHRDSHKPTPRPRARCRHCHRSFARRYTLNRHIMYHCTRAPEKTEGPKPAAPPPPPPRPAAPEAGEDARIPSDESFQNFSSSLDFSTNLFDTDRMPSLDMSHSRADDCSLYGLGYKDDTNGLSGDLGFAKLNDGYEKSQESGVDNKKKIEPILVSCAHCSQVVVQEKKKKHFRECRGRRFECGCGRVYRSRPRLAAHVRRAHPPPPAAGDAAPPQDTNLENQPTKTSDYKCHICSIDFKRRGMLVNHLHRAHAGAARAAARSVPLTARVRLYPCAACPKLYRTAAKRDAHVRRHHPGIEKVTGQTIESGLRTLEPAACDLCPRQYATRAKLLQHVRATHREVQQASKQNPAPVTEIIKNEIKLKTEVSNEREVKELDNQNGPWYFLICERDNKQ